MTFKEAMDRVLSGHKDCKVTMVLDFSDKFIVSIEPKDWNPEEILLDPFFAVDKKSGKVSEWNPIMDPEGFKKALKDGVVYKEGDKIEEEPPKEVAHYMEYTPNDLMHYGVKGMKWRQHKSLGSSIGEANIGMGAGSVEISEEEQEIQKNELAAEQLDRLASAMERNGHGKDRSHLFHTLVIRRGSTEAKKRAEVGKRKIQEIKEHVKKMEQSFQHSEGGDVLISALEYTPDDLMHFGIKGMKWGIRRFQPYQKGEKVKGGKEVGAATKVKQRPSSGNIIERYKAHKTKQKRVAALKKAQATRKANADFEAEKKKAIESGSIEDLAKFKGKLTNEEYNRAFMRLQNEQKVAALVQANQKTVWDKVDKGMEIVARVSKYANVVTTAKNNFDALDEALHRKERDAEKEKKAAEKNKFLTNIDNITELNEGVEKHKITPQEYQAAMNILANKKMNRTRFDVIGEGGDFEDKNKKAAKEKAAKNTPQDGTYRSAGDVKKNASYDNSNPSDFEAPKHAYEKTPKSTREKAGYVNSDGERGFTRPEADSGKRVISGFKNVDKPVSYNSAQTLNFGESTIRRLSATAPKASQVKKDMEPTAAEKERATRLDNVRKVYSVNRTISGAKTGNSSSYKQQANLDFGGSKVSKFSAKAPTPSKVVTDTRQTVANTQAERARQKEVDKKRKAKIK